MRVAVVVGRFPSVSETFIRLQVEGLLQSGVDVEVFALDGYPDKQDIPKLEPALERLTYRNQALSANLCRRWGYLLERLPRANSWVRRMLIRTLCSAVLSPRRIAFGSMCDLYKLLERLPFDLVHAHFGHIALRCAELPWDRTFPPLVTTFHGWDANVAPRRHGSEMYRPLFKRGALFTVNSLFLKEKLESLGCPKERIVRLPMGVDTERFSLRRHIRQHDEPVELLSVGRLVPVKGHRFAIEAVAMLQGSGRNVCYTIVGAGPLEGELRSLAETAGVADRVRFTGALSHDRVLEEYYRADIFILPSIRTDRGDEETQGVVVQEAQATGMPVIVSNVGGVPEGVINGKSGLVVEAANAEALSAGVEELIGRRNEWRDIGAAGRELVEKNFDRRKLVKSLVALYETAIQGTPSRWGELPSGDRAGHLLAGADRKWDIGAQSSECSR